MLQLVIPLACLLACWLLLLLLQKLGLSVGFR
jgi:hypothetical protein